MGFTEKTNYLLETKSLLKDRINSLGGYITSGTTFRDYLVWLDSLYEALDEKTITGLPESLEGKCEQDGTPTPSSPIPINITTGEQDIVVCGKNLCNYLPYNMITNGNGTTSISNGYYNVIIDVENISSLYISGNFSLLNSSTLRVGGYSVYPSISATGTRYNITSNSAFSTGTHKYIMFCFLASSGHTIDEIKNSFQIEIGNQGTTFEAYSGNTYEINLGKNLFDINGTVQVGTLDRYNYGFTLIKGTNRVLNMKLPQMLDAGTYILSFDVVNSNLSAVGKFGFQAILNGTGVSNNSDNTNHKITFTTTSQFNALYFYILSDQPDYATITIDNVQLQKGSGATNFAPYKTPIYLGKIGTYQDYIFRNTTENPLYDSNLEEGQWYIHKEIGRVVLNGTTNTMSYVKLENVVDTGYKVLNDCLAPANNGIVASVLTNYFTPYSINDIINNKRIGTGIRNDKVLFLSFGESSSYTTASAINTWLSSHNVEVYYVLNTPTNTLIEDEELINQLNEIEIFTVISEDFYN